MGKKLKIIRCKMTFKQSLAGGVTAQALLILNYASHVWCTPFLRKALVKEIEHVHFKAFRIVVQGYRQRISKNMISKRTNRLLPILG